MDFLLYALCSMLNIIQAFYKPIQYFAAKVIYFLHLYLFIGATVLKYVGNVT